MRRQKLRRAAIRKNRPDAASPWQALRTGPALAGLGVALGFFVLATLVTSLRERVVRYRPDQYVPHDVVSRVEFTYADRQREAELRQQAREAAPRAYRAVAGRFDELERTLRALPEQVTKLLPEQLPKELGLERDLGTVTALRRLATEGKEAYAKAVGAYVEALRTAQEQGKLVVLSREDHQKEMRAPARAAVKLYGTAPGAEAVTVPKGEVFWVGREEGGPGAGAAEPAGAAAAAGGGLDEAQRSLLLTYLSPIAEGTLPAPVAARLAGYTAETMRPTHELDRDLTAAAQAEAERSVSLAPARRTILKNETILVHQGETVTAAHWPLLVAEQQAFVEQLPWERRLLSHLGMGALVLLVTACLGTYAAAYQPRVVQNPMRALGLGLLLLSMLLVAHLAALGTWPLMFFATAPTLLAVMILAIAYDQRFAIGVGTLHAMLVAASLGQGVGFFVVLWGGVMACCFLLDEVRSRSKLVEVGGVTAVVMMGAAAAVGAAALEPAGVIGRNCLYAGASGLGVGFVVLGILDFVERKFKITTSMTLLEYADISQPLLRRLSAEAPGTYSHSLQVATLAEAAAEAIGANSLLCRVGSYYHDVGKLHKPHYFCENQFGGENRHLSLSPSVSHLIIVNHVKDGVEMAKEYGVPPAILPIIQQHHGTTLVEFFYRRACEQAGQQPDAAEVSDTQYRYPGPKPQSRECVVVMLADAAESATRAMTDPTPGRVEGLVHALVQKRLLDGQFDESDITMAELAIVERTLVKTLMGLYHGRVAYPTTEGVTNGEEEQGPREAKTG